MHEFVINGQTYRSGKMNAKTQFHVGRRMAPVMTPLQTAITGTGGLNGIAGVVEAIGSLSDETADYIVDNCLAVVQRQQGESWAPVKPATSRTSCSTTLI